MYHSVVDNSYTREYKSNMKTNINEKCFPLPPLRIITMDDYANLVQPYDILAMRHSGWSVVEWGQEKWGKQAGYDADTSKTLAQYTHAAVAIDNQGLCFETLPPKARYSTIYAAYPDRELLVLRPAPGFTDWERMAIKKAIPRREGTTYGYTDYLVYPFYMAYGWAPGWWRRMWDDPDKPVCSGMAVELYQAAGRLMAYKPVITVPPARLPILDGLSVVARIRVITPPNAPITPIPWWLR